MTQTSSTRSSTRSSTANCFCNSVFNARRWTVAQSHPGGRVPGPSAGPPRIPVHRNQISNRGPGLCPTDRRNAGGLVLSPMLDLTGSAEIAWAAISPIRCIKTLARRSSSSVSRWSCTASSFPQRQVPRDSTDTLDHPHIPLSVTQITGLRAMSFSIRGWHTAGVILRGMRRHHNARTHSSTLWNFRPIPTSLSVSRTSSKPWKTCMKQSSALHPTRSSAWPSMKLPAHA